MATFRGPRRPKQPTWDQHPDQLGLSIPRPPRRRPLVWEPGDPVHEPPEPVDPEPRPAVLAADDDHPDDAATWSPTLVEPPAPRRLTRRSLVEDLLDP